MTKTAELWANENSGQIACPDHGGSYLKHSIYADPWKRTHVTPLGTWNRMTPDDAAYFLMEIGQPAACEVCGSHNTPFPN